MSIPAPIMKEMIQEAKEKYGDIKVIGTRNSFEESFTIMGNSILFWFHDNGESCHLIKWDVAQWQSR